MSKSMESGSGKLASFGEKGSRFLRNINLLGAAALTGAAILFPELSAPLLAFAAIDVAQAGMFEFFRRFAGKGKGAAKLSPSPA